MKLQTLGFGLLLPAAFAVGCSSNPAREPARADLSTYCRVASRAGLNSWVGSLVTTCTDEDESGEGTCSLFRVRGTNLDPVSLPASVTNPIWAAETSSALFVLSDAGQLSRIQGSEVEVIAPLARDPSLSSAGDRLVFMAAPEGVTEWDFDVQMLIQSYSVRSRAVSTVIQDEFAYSPQAIPGSADVLFASSRTSVPAIFRVSPGGDPTQLTNVGMTTMEQESVPPLTAQSLWANDGVYFAYAIDATESSVLHLNITTGEISDVGPGFWPRLDANNDILALAPAGSTPCAFTYAAGGAR